MTQLTTKGKRSSEVRLILKDLLKVIKVVAMYPEGNPLPQSLRRSFSEKLAAIVDEYGEIKLVIEAERIVLDKENVFVDTSKEDSLAGLFFTCGITSLTFGYPLDVVEVYAFLDAIKTYHNESARGADLVSLLWEANFAKIKYTTIEDISLAAYDGDFKVQEILISGQDASGKGDSGYDSIFTQDDTDADGGSGGLIVELPDDVTDEEVRQLKKIAAQQGLIGDDASESVAIDGRELIRKFREARRTNATFYLVDPHEQAESSTVERGIDSSTLKVAEAAKAMGYTDLMKAPIQAPDTALILNDEFKLTEEEEQEIRSLLEADTAFDMYESTIELTAELLRQEADLSAFFETVGICEKLIMELVASGRLNEACRMLDHIHALEDELEKPKPLWAERLRDARIAVGSAPYMKQLAEALNKNPQLPARDIQNYLNYFGWEALGAITNLLGDLEHRAHRELLCDFLSDRGRDNIATIAKGIHDKRWFVVRNSVGILARMKDEKAMDYLLPALKHDDKRVRLEVMSAVKERTDPRVTEILKRALLDKDVEIRQTALKSLMANRGKGSFDAVAAMISHATFPTFEGQEQTEAFKTYSILGGEQALAYLRDLATRINLFNDSLIALHRAAAFVGLAHNPSPRAEALLLKLRSHWVPDIRRRAREAITLRREVMSRAAVAEDTASETSPSEPEAVDVG